MSIREQMVTLGRQARKAARALAGASGEQRTRALLILADLLEENAAAISAANEKDVAAAHAQGLDAAKIQRLTITDKVLASMVEGCREVAAMADPLGEIESMKKRPNGMLVGKMRIPLGVVAMIYESRPNATIDAGILCLKAGNAVILRGGSEAFHSNTALAKIMHQALHAAALPRDAVQVPATTDRAAVAELLTLDEYIDVVIPRGGEGLIRAVTQQATMPVLKHYKGVCHMFADASCSVEKALDIIENAKMQYPSGCNALECLLVHRTAAKELLLPLAERLGPQGVGFRACPEALPLLGAFGTAASKDDWGTEFLALTLAVKVVSGIDEAMDFIALHGSNHTEAILTEEHSRAMRFVREVDASLVVVNASTRFNDGAQLGLGAEIGISTSKLHAYGPMGVRELTSSKFVLLGDWQTRG